ncbi:hypothetical protein Ana3638_09995 [Anaerocolumna sedimenticola]|uniref:Uncharacterized protein n=1 Tax=Anaerocolumna sedimenticola TaxID=2696063 RepID=A0A6P1TM93_9FIRM|nr:hypothetical protein [Anaerocolumna sedimenticola]QHQ61061.1 hypothetical protein Ana3638_09995 [Anaerocolumna sedimenticola]
MKFTIKQKIIIDLLISAAVTIILTCTILNSLYYVDRSNSKLMITALGSKNGESTASEVRIHEISLNNNKVDFNSLKLPQEWKVNGEYLNYYGINQPVSFILDLKDIKVIDILFAKSSDAGKVKLQIDSHEETIDLYENISWDEYHWIYKTNKVFKPFSRIYFLIPQFFIIFIVVSKLNNKEFLLKCKLFCSKKNLIKYFIIALIVNIFFIYLYC